MGLFWGFGLFDEVDFFGQKSLILVHVRLKKDLIYRLGESSVGHYLMNIGHW